MDLEVLQEKDRWEAYDKLEKGGMILGLRKQIFSNMIPCKVRTELKPHFG